VAMLRGRFGHPRLGQPIARAYVSAVRPHREKVRRDHRLEDRIAQQRPNSTQALQLLRRETHSGHLEVLRPDPFDDVLWYGHRDSTDSDRQLSGRERVRLDGGRERGVCLDPGVAASGHRRPLRGARPGARSWRKCENVPGAGARCRRSGASRGLESLRANCLTVAPPTGRFNSPLPLCRMPWDDRSRQARIRSRERRRCAVRKQS